MTGPLIALAVMLVLMCLAFLADVITTNKALTYSNIGESTPFQAYLQRKIGKWWWTFHLIGLPIAAALWYLGNITGSGDVPVAAALAGAGILTFFMGAAAHSNWRLIKTQLIPPGPIT